MRGARASRRTPFSSPGGAGGPNSGFVAAAAASVGLTAAFVGSQGRAKGGGIKEGVSTSVETLLHTLRDAYFEAGKWASEQLGLPPPRAPAPQPARHAHAVRWPAADEPATEPPPLSSLLPPLPPAPVVVLAPGRAPIVVRRRPARRAKCKPHPILAALRSAPSHVLRFAARSGFMADEGGVRVRLAGRSVDRSDAGAFTAWQATLPVPWPVPPSSSPGVALRLASHGYEASFASGRLVSADVPPTLLRFDAPRVALRPEWRGGVVPRLCLAASRFAPHQLPWDGLRRGDTRVRALLSLGGASLDASHVAARTPMADGGGGIGPRGASAMPLHCATASARLGVGTLAAAHATACYKLRGGCGGDGAPRTTVGCLARASAANGLTAFAFAKIKTRVSTSQAGGGDTSASVKVVMGLAQPFSGIELGMAGWRLSAGSHGGKAVARLEKRAAVDW